MGSRIYENYKKEIQALKNDENTESIFLVGSSKKLDLKDKNLKINDIDIFVVTKKGGAQTRVIKTIEEIEYDINFFSVKGTLDLIESREYFFLKEMSNPKVLYDANNNCENLINLCLEKLKEGPKKLTDDEKIFMKSQIKGNIERLKSSSEKDDFELNFLTDLYLKDIMIGYFAINNKWIPKEKKLISSVQKEDKQFFDLIKIALKNKKYEDLLNVYKYTFNNIKVSKNIKITY